MTEKILKKVVFIGEVDHGKSTLLAQIVRAQSRFQFEETVEAAHLVDQLVEERERNMTIDSTEVKVDYEGRSFGLIDAPGHLELLRNMATGSARADAAILVIDVLTGLTPQTKRHLAAASALGCRELIVAVNKMDTVSFSESAFKKTAHDAKKLVEDLCDGLANDPAIVPLAALGGIGINDFPKELSWYKGPTLLQRLKTLQSKDPSTLSLVLPIQDIYEHNESPLFVGKICSGTLKKGGKVKIGHSGKEGIITKILKYPQEVDQAEAGESVAFALESAPGEQLARGDILCDPQTDLKPSITAKGHFIWLDETPLKVGEKIDVRCATQQIQAVVTRIRSQHYSSSPSGKEDETAYGETAKIELSLKDPIVTSKKGSNSAEELQRLVLARAGGLVAGGLAI